MSHVGTWNGSRLSCTCGWKSDPGSESEAADAFTLHLHTVQSKTENAHGATVRAIADRIGDELLPSLVRQFSELRSLLEND